jgi:hypothetical protein
MVSSTLFRYRFLYILPREGFGLNKQLNGIQVWPVFVDFMLFDPKLKYM